MSDENINVGLNMQTRNFTQSVGKVTGGFSKIGFAIKGILSYQIGTFFISQFGSAVKAIANFEYQMDKVAAISGATSTQMKALTQNAIDIGNASKFTAEEVGKLQEVLARRGFDPENIINMTDSIRKLGLASSSSLSSTADAIGSVVQSFQFSTKDTDRIANTLAESFASTNLELSTFRTAIGYVGTAANQSNVSLEETVAMLGVITNGGIKASTAGRGLRKVFLKLSQQGIGYKEALEQIRDSQNPLVTSMGLFGAQFATVGVLLSENIPKIDELTEKYSDNNEELQKQVDIMEDNLLTDWDKLLSKQNALIVSQGGVSDGLKGVVGYLNDMADYITVINNNSDGLLDFIYSIGNPSLGGIKAYESVVKTINDATKNFNLGTEAIEIFNLAQKEGITSSEDYLAVQHEFINSSREFSDRVTINQKVMDLFSDAEIKAKEGGVELNKEQEKQIVNLTILESKLKELNEAYSLIAEDNKEALRLAAAEINSTKEQIEAIKAHITAEEDAFKRRQKIRQAEQKERQKAFDGFQSTEKLYSSGGGLGMSLPGNKAPDFDPSDEMLASVDRWAEFGQMMSEEIMSAGLAIGDAFTDFLADAAVGNHGAGQRFEESIANIAGVLGQALITLGTGSVAFQSLLTTAFSNPASAIAAISAGAALVAYSKIAKANIKNESNRRMASKSPGGGANSSSSPSPDYGAFMEATRGEMAFRINGADLVTIMNVQNRRTKING